MKYISVVVHFVLFYYFSTTHTIVFSIWYIVCCARAGVSEMNILFLFGESVSLYRQYRHRHNYGECVISRSHQYAHAHTIGYRATHERETKKNINKTTRKQIDLMAMLLVACVHHHKPICIDIEPLSTHVYTVENISVFFLSSFSNRI